MGCFGGFFGFRKEREPRPEQKWDAISLRDFKSGSWWTAFAYGYLHFDILLSLAVYGVDTFTAINLLAFNRWSSSIEPTQLVPQDVLKWIFAACIIASFVNLILEHFRSLRVRKRGNVAECYLDNLAVRMESIRWSGGQGWRRFLVFAELTKSKKGGEYIALFTFFSFQAWIRVLVCSGPRQVVNGLTLYAVYKSTLIPTDNSSVGSTLGSFFDKLGTLYDENNQQAVILSGMLFTLIIWIFSALFILIGALFYVCYLWSYIPKEDGSLRRFCERKINKRLMRIVTAKVNKALEKEEQKLRKLELKEAKKTGEMPKPSRQATLPQLMDPVDTDKLPEMPMMARSETMTTLPAYSSRPGTPSNIQMNHLGPQNSQASLMGNAAGMGYGPPASPVPSLPTIDLNAIAPPARTGTANSYRTPGTAPPNRMPTPGSAFSGPSRTASPAVYSPDDALPSMPEPARSPAPPGAFGRPAPEPARSPAPLAPYGRPMPRQVGQLSGRPMPPSRSPFEYRGDGRTNTAASSVYSVDTSVSYGAPHGGPMYPQRSQTNPPVSYSPMSPLGQSPPQRNMTAPIPHQPSGYGYGHGPGMNQRGPGMDRPGYSYDADPEGQRGYRPY